MRALLHWIHPRQLAWAVLGLALLAGCRSIRMTPGLDTSVLAREPATAPGKYSQRVAQFVFLSDF
jgi:hypothetical protein